MSKRTVMGIVLALLLIIAGTGAFLIFRSTFTRPEQPKAVRPRSYWVQRSEEVPLASHRALSMVASQRATALLPWGIALDSLHGFTWVAGPIRSRRRHLHYQFHRARGILQPPVCGGRWQWGGLVYPAQQ